MSKIEQWGVVADLIDLQGRGVTGKPAARAVLPKIEEWARRVGQPAPTVEAVAKAITRYFATPAGDGRTKQAKAQAAVETRSAAYAEDLVVRRIDALAMLEGQVAWTHEKLQQVDRLLQQMETALKSEDKSVPTPDLREVAMIFKAYSSELRGWLELLVEVKDKIYVHQQYEQAFREILAAIMAEAPDKAPSIANRLRSNPVVANILRMRAVEGDRGE